MSSSFQHITIYTYWKPNLPPPKKKEKEKNRSKMLHIPRKSCQVKIHVVVNLNSLRSTIEELCLITKFFNIRQQLSMQKILSKFGNQVAFSSLTSKYENKRSWTWAEDITCSWITTAVRIKPSNQCFNNFSSLLRM